MLPTVGYLVICLIGLVLIYSGTHPGTTRAESNRFGSFYVIGTVIFIAGLILLQLAPPGKGPTL